MSHIQTSGGTKISQRGVLIYYLAYFFRKTDWKWKKLTETGCEGSVPPLISHCKGKHQNSVKFNSQMTKMLATSSSILYTQLFLLKKSCLHSTYLDKIWPIYSIKIPFIRSCWELFLTSKIYYSLAQSNPSNDHNRRDTSIRRIWSGIRLPLYRALQKFKDDDRYYLRSWIIR